jgi:hypothetical protein
MARNSKNRNKNNSYRPNFWGMLQNVLIGSMNKGQLPFATISLILIILVIKYPSDKIPEFTQDLFNISTFNSIFGWCIGIITTFSGYYINKRQRREHTTEVRRLSNEKKKLQEKINGGNLPSSNN